MNQKSYVFFIFFTFDFFVFIFFQKFKWTVRIQLSKSTIMFCVQIFRMLMEMFVHLLLYSIKVWKINIISDGYRNKKYMKKIKRKKENNHWWRTEITLNSIIRFFTTVKLYFFIIYLFFLFFFFTCNNPTDSFITSALKTVLQQR